MDTLTDSISSTLILPARLDHLHPLLAYTRELAKSSGFLAKEQQELELSIEEIVTNIIQHGYENNRQETFQINFEITATKITVKFSEKGLPFDPATLPHYSPEQATADTKGLGIYLARKFVDDIVFRYLGRHGKETILTKYLRQQQPLIQKTMVETTETKAVADVKYQIRRVQPEDGIPVARCAYRAYGYSYADHVYDPVQLIEQNKTGSLISLVVRSEEDEDALGYGDLRLYGEIAEVESIFIKPEYRSTRIFYKLALALVAESRRQNLFGHFCLSVTSHIISQKGARFMGLSDCGILLGFMPETDFKSMSLHTHHRVSVAMEFGVLKDRLPVTIYPPSRHCEMISQIYTVLKVPFVIDNAPSNDVATLQEATVYHLEIQSDMNIAILRLSAYGPDATAIIGEQTSQCSHQVIDVIYLYLDLHHPSTADITVEAEKIGFFFAGVLPAGLEGRDALILQYLNVSLDWDEIKLATPFAHELLTYVRHESDRVGHHPISTNRD
ncbi:MAG TPA: ATP-binding protein [Patescibacteria group bacterium]|nr:ATP-binding protein [Patescibacteria group bacterium]